jgi:hypothetical protein
LLRRAALLQEAGHADRVIIIMHELLELVGDTVQYLDAAGADAGVSKQDVVDSARERLCRIMQKIVAFPLTTNFSLPCLAHGDTLDLSDLAQ